jgi:hypothetical protein
MKGERG